jgi:hypothetical protein
MNFLKALHNFKSVDLDTTIKSDDCSSCLSFFECPLHTEALALLYSDALNKSEDGNVTTQDILDTLNESGAGLELPLRNFLNRILQAVQNYEKQQTSPS